jgi:hypothetical protein
LESRWWRALSGASGVGPVFAAHITCIFLLLFAIIGVALTSSVLRGFGLVWAEATADTVVIASSTVLSALVFVASLSAQGAAIRRTVSRAAWAAPLVLAALGSIVLGAMLLGRERMMVAVLAGWTALFSTVPFLLLWAVYALVCAIRSNLTTLQLLAVFRRCMDAGLIGVAIAWGIALLAGGHLIRLVALSGFYAFFLPWVIGFGLALPPPKQPSRRFAALSIALAACMALSAIPWPFSVRHDIECQWWYPAGRHAVYAFHDEPWHWRPPAALDWFIAPAALGELTIRTIAQPLTELRCAAPWNRDPWDNYPGL